jgi:hypothetical protein
MWEYTLCNFLLPVQLTYERLVNFSNRVFIFSSMILEFTLLSYRCGQIAIHRTRRDKILMQF